MATRLYFAATTGPTGAITPGFAAWTRTSEGIRRWMGPTKDGSTLTGTTFWANAAASANTTCLGVQFVSDRLAAGIAFVTSDTVKCVAQARESAANDNINRSPICVKVYSEDGTTLRATLLGLGHVGPNTTEWLSSGLRSKQFADGDALTAGYTTVVGDRLVVEIGGQVSGSAGTSVTGTINIGSSAGSDLAENETATTAADPWFEISRTLTFADYTMTATGTSYAWAGTDATLTYVPRFHLKASAYIAASAADVTTARLTAPSGKTTGDFDAGFISDDTNPLPTIDITADGYTEVEWCLEAAAGLTTDDVFEFRVVDSADTPLDTYTETPTWTVGAGTNDYTLTADAASWDWAGATVGLLFGAAVIAGTASYAWAGTDAGLLAGHELQPEVAAYEWTPSDAHLWASPYAWALVTNPAGAVAGVPFTTQPVLEVRTAAGYLSHAVGLTVNAAPATYLGTLGSLTGTVNAVTDADGRATFTDLAFDTAQDGAYLWFTGESLGDVYFQLDVDGPGTLTAESSSYAWDVQDATLTFTPTGDYALTAEAVAWDWVGTDAGLAAGYRVDAVGDAYVWAGTGAGLLAGYAVLPDAGAWDWAVTDATLTLMRPIRLVASAYIAGSAADPTTARLTAPSGKTTGDFEAGLISDDTNPLPTLDLGSGAYTELEWCIETDAGLIDDDVYEFRVVASDGTPLDTYTVTPTWTIGAGGAYSLTAEAATYDWTPTDAGLLAGYEVGAEATSWTWTPAAASLLPGFAVLADAAAYTWTPSDAHIWTTPSFWAVVTPVDGAVAGVPFTTQPVLELRTANAYPSYAIGVECVAELFPPTLGTLSGTTSVYTDALGRATFTDLSIDTAQDGAQLTFYTPSGPSSAIDTFDVDGSGAITASPASYTWAGADAGLLASHVLAAEALAWDWTVADATLDYVPLSSYTLDAEPVAYTWAVQDATLQPMSPPGIYEWTPQSAGLLGAFRLTIDAGAWAWTGSDAGLLRGASITADPVAYTWTGTDADLVATTAGEYLLLADPAVYTWTVADAGLRRASPLTALPATYLWTVADAALWLNLGAPTLPPEPCYADLWAPTVRAHRLPIRAYARLGDAMRDYILMDAGDLLPVFQATLIDANNDRVNLTGATAITLHLTRYRGLAEQASTPVEATYACSVVGDAADGVVQYAWQAGETDDAGNYRGYIHVLYTGGDDRRIPTSGFISLIIRP